MEQLRAAIDIYAAAADAERAEYADILARYEHDRELGAWQRAHAERERRHRAGLDAARSRFVAELAAEIERRGGPALAGTERSDTVTIDIVDLARLLVAADRAAAGAL